MKLLTLRFAVYFALALAITGCGGSGSSKTITVAITGASSTIAPSGTFNLTATVNNDTSGRGVTWSSTDTGLSQESSTSALYTAPGAVPTNNTVTVTATSIADPTKSAKATFLIANGTAMACQPSPQPRGGESALTLPLAFIVKGADSSDVPIAYAGSFTGDGQGGIENADADVVGYDTGAEHLDVDVDNSSYSYGADGRGCLYLVFNQDASVKKSPDGARKSSKSPAHSATKRFANTRQGITSNLSVGHTRKGQSHPTRAAVRPQVASAPATLVLSFALAGGSGRIIEFDDSTGSGTISAGQIIPQNSEAFSVSSLSSNFAFGVDGWVEDGGLNRLAIAGSFKNVNGALSLGVADDNVGGNVSGQLSGGSGSLDNSVDNTTGRGTGSYSTAGAGGFSFDFTYYIVTGGDIFLLSSDDPSETGVSLGGRALSSSATSIAPNGYYMFALSGLDCSTCATDAGHNAVAVGTLHATSALSATGTIFANDAGNFTNGPFSGGYTFDTTSGRASLPGIPGGPIAYVTKDDSPDNIAAFLVGTDDFASSGFVGFQETGTPQFGADDLSGSFSFGSTEDVTGVTGGLVGVFVLDGLASYTGTIDKDHVGTGLAPDTPITGTYSVSQDGSGNFDDSNEVFITNGMMMYAIDGGNGDQPFLYVLIQPQTEENRAKKPIAQSATHDRPSPAAPWNTTRKSKQSQAKP